jgi:hypothetical protein
MIWNDFCIKFVPIVKPMRKFITMTAILLSLAYSAFAGGYPQLPDYRFVPDLHTSSYSNADQPEIEIDIFPNPVTEGRLTITTSEDILIVQIMNITGKIVFSQEYQPNTNSVVIELNKVEKGVYLVRLGFTDKISRTEKIMVK